MKTFCSLLQRKKKSTGLFFLMNKQNQLNKHKKKCFFFLSKLATTNNVPTWLCYQDINMLEEPNMSTLWKETEVQYNKFGRISPFLQYLYYYLILLWLNIPVGIPAGMSWKENTKGFLESGALFQLGSLAFENQILKVILFTKGLFYTYKLECFQMTLCFSANSFFNTCQIYSWDLKSIYQMFIWTPRAGAHAGWFKKFFLFS